MNDRVVSVPVRSRFDARRWTTLLLFNALLFLGVEILLQLGLGELILPAKPPSGTLARGLEPSALTHHDYVPSARFTTRLSERDTGTGATNEINSVGIRGPELKPKSVYRVLNLGDSFLQADEIAFADTFGEKLNSYFSTSIEFITHGISGWAPTPCFSWIYHKGLQLEPDEVNLFLYENDFHRGEVQSMVDANYRRQATYEGKVPVRYRPEKSEETLLRRAKDLLLKVELVRLVNSLRNLRLRIGPSTVKKKIAVVEEMLLLDREASEWPPDLRTNVDETLAVVRDARDFLGAREIETNVFFIPTGLSWEDEVVAGKTRPIYGWDADFSVTQTGLRSYIKKTFTGWAIPYVDLHAYLDSGKKAAPEKLLYFEEDGHWNEEGHSVVFGILRDLYDARGPMSASKPR